jgi:NAD(P)-dependent dehydrogenase (short-subunit alcohol dehydrogenase family)
MDTRIIAMTGGSGFVGQGLVKWLEADGYTVRNFKGDVADEKAVERFAEELKGFGPIHGIVHLASPPLSRGPLLSQSAALFDAHLRVAALGAFFLCKHLCPLLRKEAVIVGILSREIERITFPSGSYVPAKYALRGLLKVLSRELKDVRVFGVSPAFMPGGLWRDLPESVINFFATKSKPEDITSPEAVAAAIAELLGDTAQKGGVMLSLPSGKKEPL